LHLDPILPRIVAAVFALLLIGLVRRRRGWFKVADRDLGTDRPHDRSKDSSGFAEKTTNLDLEEVI
jgi:hypothetical protein